MGLQPLTDSNNPLSLYDVKVQLRIVDDLIDPCSQQPYSSDDAALTVYLEAAFEYIETATRQQLCNRDYVLTLDCFPEVTRHEGHARRSRQTYEIVLPKPPLVSVSAVYYYDQTGTMQILNPSLYIVDTTTKPGRIVLVPGQSWPKTNNAANCIQIAYTAGYGGSVPTILKQAILLLAGDWYENREDSYAGRINSIPTGVQAIINQYSFPEAVG
jgi:uncharacterized phiE125 gp8 family phage protein